MKKALLVVISGLGMCGCGVGTGLTAMINRHSEDLSSIPDASSSLPLLTSCSAIGIANHRAVEMVYFYSNRHRQEVWYKTTLGAHESTWDWGWSNYHTNNAIEFKLTLSNGKTMYIVDLYRGYQYILGVAVASQTLYYTYGNPDNIPDRNSKIWYHVDTRSTSYDSNFHTEFMIDNHGLYLTLYSPIHYVKLINFN